MTSGDYDMWVGYSSGIIGPFLNTGSKRWPKFTWGVWVPGVGTNNVFEQRGRRPKPNPNWADNVFAHRGRRRTSTAKYRSLTYDFPVAVDIDSDGFFFLLFFFFAHAYARESVRIYVCEPWPESAVVQN